MCRSEKSAEVVVVKDWLVKPKALAKDPARMNGLRHVDGGGSPISFRDEATLPRHETEHTGSVLLRAANL